MKCGFCGLEIPVDHVQKPCGLCAGGCRKIHCPYCGHENPATPAYLRRFTEKDQTPGKLETEKDQDP